VETRVECLLKVVHLTLGVENCDFVKVLMYLTDKHDVLYTYYILVYVWVDG